MLGKKEPEIEDLENSQPIHMAKNKKACSGEDTMGMAGKSFDKGIRSEIPGFNQPSQQNLAIELVLHQQKHCQTRLKGEEIRQIEGRLSDF